MFVNIKISSKNKRSLDQFLKYLISMTSISKLKLKTVFKQFHVKKSRKVFTLLKSPHVNKKAQKHFEYITISSKASVTSFQIFKLLVFLKKIQKCVGFDISVKLKFMVNRSIDVSNFSWNIHPHACRVRFHQKKVKPFDPFVKIYLKYFDTYGSFGCLNSSVGRAKD